MPQSISRVWLLTLAFDSLLCFSIHAEVSPQEQARFRELGWAKSELMIPTRDGVRLYTEVYRPLQSSEALPILLTRTPYGVNVAATNLAASLTNQLKELVADGYIFVRQDVRGKFKSEGQFVMMRPPRHPGREAVDESTDTYDTIDWLVKNLPDNNGRVGIHGTSYLGWTTVMGVLSGHPALRAACEEASPADMFLGDDFHHNGAFRLSYAYEYAYSLETARTNVPVSFDRYDAYEWYLRLGSLANVNRSLLQGRIPTWNDYVQHPNYDAFWQRQAVAPYMTNVPVPILHVAGWWDQEDFYGPLKIYEALEAHDTMHQNFLVAGPWNHGGWNGGEARKLGNLDFDSATGRYFREQIKARWFARYLKEKTATDFPEAITFQTGANQWESHTSWPPRDGIERRRLYFQANGGLGFSPPQDASRRASDSYLSDPAHPVPYRNRPVQATYADGSRWSTWLLEDQRFVHNRPDVLSYETGVLTNDLAVTGEAFAQIFASTTGSDADWIVKLIDVYPQSYPSDPKMGGYQLMVANEVFRGRFRDSFEHPKAIPSNRVVPYRFSLHALNHRFLKGHQIMVQIQSTWFPIIDRNPQKFIPNIYEAADSDFQPATHRIFHNRSFPSHLDLPVRTTVANLVAKGATAELVQPVTARAADSPALPRSNHYAQNPPRELAQFFAPPEKYRSDFGSFRSPLVFNNGSRVQSSADWLRRREEILSSWHRFMGPWPPLNQAPRVEIVNTTRRENITQLQVRMQIALGQEMVDGLLLLPEHSSSAAKRPAVLVVYYDAESGAGLGTPRRDYAWQLARRGFVALSIGKPNARVDFTDHSRTRGDPYLGPVGQMVRVQPLSALAYAAANAHTVLAQRPEVDPARIGIVGHSFGGKWALMASCLYDKFACAVWSDPGIVFDERDRRKENPSGSVNYWDVWYLGFQLGELAEPQKATVFRKLPGEGQDRTGAYKSLVETGHDLVELHALMAPRPFLVSGGTADLPERWPALNHAIAVNKLLGYDQRVAMTSHPTHDPTEEANEQVYLFFESFLPPASP